MDNEESKGAQESAQETAEMPKAPEAAAGNEAAEADGTAWWTGKRKGIAAGIAAAAVIACIGAGMAVASQQPQTVDGAQQEEQAAEQDGTAAPASTLEAAITAESWTDDSSAFIAHVYGTDSDGNAVDTYHAFTASGDKAMGIAQGSYTLEWVPAINADGSICRTPEATPLNATGGAVKAEQAFEKVPADQVTADDLNAILDKVTVAVEKGDSTLSGEAGKTVVDKAVSNASANANADKEAVEAKKQVADTVADAKAEGKDASAAKQEAQQKTPASVTQNSGSQKTSSGTSAANVGGQSSGSDGSTNQGNSSSTSGNSGSSSSQKQEHVHTWATKTVVTGKEYVSPEYEYVEICACGAENPSKNHSLQHALNDEPGNTHVVKRTVKEGYYKDITSTVTYCTGCGLEK